MNYKTPIVIVGPTASGKSDLAIALAQKHGGEIISADSRQVYRGMDIGTGKVTKKEQELARHHLLDVASPKRNYNVSHFIRDAQKALKNIQYREKLPIVCGGTGFWVQAFLEGISFPEAKPDLKLRRQLQKRSAEELFKILQKKDPHRAQMIDPHNKIRLIRALEVIETLGRIPSQNQMSKNKKVPALIIALNPPKEKVKENIKKRLEKRLRQGLIQEAAKLRENGLSWEKLESFGLEYRYVSLFLQRKLDQEEMMAKLETEIWHYAKRQLSYLRRWERQGTEIHWVANKKEALLLTKKVFS